MIFFFSQAKRSYSFAEAAINEIYAVIEKAKL